MFSFIKQMLINQLGQMRHKVLDELLATSLSWRASLVSCKPNFYCKTVIYYSNRMWGRLEWGVSPLSILFQLRS